MAARRQHDYQQVLDQCVSLVEAGVKPEWGMLGDKLGIAPTTLQHILRKMGISHPDALKTRAKNNIPVYDNLEDGDTLTHTAAGNYDEYVSVSVSGQIKSVEDLVRVCKIDTEKYILLPPEIRKWDVTVKLRSQDGDDKVIIVPQIYISVKTLARNPEPVMPVFRPLEITLGNIPALKEPHGKVLRELIIPDVHMGFRRRLHTSDLSPFHDRRALDLVCQILKDGWFDGISIIGDALDFSEFSTKFTPEPEFYFTTQPAMIEWAWWLGQFREASSAKIRQYEGNHDKRLETMLVAYMRAAYGLRPVDELEMPPSMSVERLLALETLGVEYVKGYPDNYQWLNKNVMVRHGDVVRAGPGDSAKAVINRTTYTTIFGHIHRRELVSRRIKSREGDIIQHAICPGCVCHIDGRVPGSSSDQQWQQGLAVVEYTDNMENIIPIPIDEGMAIYNGRIFKARDRDAEINKMLSKNLEKIK